MLGWRRPFLIHRPGDVGCTALFIVVLLIGAGLFGLGYSFWSADHTDPSRAQLMRELQIGSGASLCAGAIILVALIIYRRKHR